MATQERATPYHHGDLRVALLDAALTLIDREGAEGLTLRKVAAAAGVSHTAPYRHFADKTALLAAVAEEGFRDLSEQMIAACEAAAGTPRLQVLGVAYVAYATSHPHHFRIMFGPELADRSPYRSLCEASEGAFGLLIGAIADGQAAGAIRAGDPQTLAIAAWSIVHGLSSLLLNGQLMPLPIRPDVATGLGEMVTGVLYGGLACG